MMRVVRAFSVLALIVLFISTLATAPAWAQLATAELNGRVTDSSGAVLPGVTVTATQTATGLVRTAVTDGDGAYLISNLPTGPYRLEVSLQGFRSYVQTGLVLQVGATPTVNAVARARLARGDGHRRSRGAARRRPQRRHQRGRRERAHRRAAAAGPPGHRPARARRARRCRRRRRRSRVHAGRRADLGRRRAADRRRLHARRRDAQQPAGERQPAAAVSRRAPGVPRRDQRPVRAERRQVGGGGQRRDQVGHQPVLGERLRVPAPSSVQRDEPVCGDRPRRQADGRRPEAQPVRRHAGRPDRAGTSCSSSAPTRAPRCVSGRRRTSPTCRPPRCWRATSPTFASPAVQRRPAGHPARAVREQPDRSGALQPGGAEPRASGCRARPIRAARSPTTSRPTATRRRRSRGSTTRSSANHSFFGRYLVTRFTQPPGYAGGSRQHPEDRRPGHRRHRRTR